MDERIDLSMSDPDLVPLLIQVYIFGFLWGCVVISFGTETISCYL